MEDFNYKAVIEKAFKASWDLINRSEGWKTAKTTTLACENVDKVEWTYVDAENGTGSSNR